MRIGINFSQNLNFTKASMLKNAPQNQLKRIKIYDEFLF